MKTGIELISEERKRQVNEEGWTPEHDAQHVHGQLSKAAACYALDFEEIFVMKAEKGSAPQSFDPWPWFNDYYRYSDGPPTKIKAWDKRKEHDRITKLKIAGALIAAEIDRIQAEE